MSIITRVCLVVALLLGGASIWLGRELATDIKERDNAKIAAKKDADKARADMKTAQDEAAAKKKEADDATGKVAGLTTQVTEQTAKVTTLQGQVDELKKKIAATPAAAAGPGNAAELNDLKTKLAATEQARDAAALQAKESADKIKALTDQVAATDGEKKIINEKLKESNAKINYYEGKDGVTLPEGLSGKVLYYDKTWNFAVLDIGKKKGVLPSGIMIIHRGTDIVGKVRIATVDDDCCVADFLGDFKKKEPKPGDMAIP
ncbi:MAG: hypothetical protein WCV00_01990 [Verrucomicrobiia bacterium]